MKKGIKIISLVVVIILIFIVLLNLNKKNDVGDSNFKILSSFYPIYVITLNIADGADNVVVSNMTESNTGCIHDYTLSTTDLRKFEDTDVFIENGKGLESFTDNITSIYPEVKIIESAKDVENLLQNEDELNGHVWLNIDNYSLQVKSIAESLALLNEKNKEVYLNNLNLYLEKLNALKVECESLQNEENKKAICLNESLEYLLDYLNIKTYAINTDHEQQALSAEVIKNTIEKMKEEEIDAIFVDKDDNLNAAEVLANETGAKIYTLNSGMSGSNSKDDYLNIMKENLNIIKNIKF